jgi:hypothetical protein
MEMFKQLDLWMHKLCMWRIGGCIGPSPTPPSVPSEVYVEWARTQPARYRRAVALHEAGHAVVAEILLPYCVKEVQLGNVSVLSEAQQEIVRQSKADFVDGQTVYESPEISDGDAADWLQRRITVISAGIAFQNLEGFEAADTEVTEDVDAGLINATLAQFEREFQISQDARLEILDRMEGIILDLRHDEGVCKAVTEVADGLLTSSPMPGSGVRQIVERNCSEQLLERVRAPGISSQAGRGTRTSRH